MLWKIVVWVATGVICCLILVLLVPTVLKVLYGTMKIFASAARAHWRGQR